MYRCTYLKLVIDHRHNFHSILHKYLRSRLQPLKDLQKRLRLIRPLDGILSLDHKIRHPSNKLSPRLLRLPIDLLPSLLTLQHPIHLRLIQPRRNRRLPQHRGVSNILLILKIRPEQPLGHARLQPANLLTPCRRLGFFLLQPRIPQQPVRVARAARAPAEAERNALGLADGAEPREDGGRALAAEFGCVEGVLIDAWVGGRLRVQVEGVPGQGEGVRGVGGFVGGYGAGEPAEADVAPLSGFC